MENNKILDICLGCLKKFKFSKKLKRWETAKKWAFKYAKLNKHICELKKIKGEKKYGK